MVEFDGRQKLLRVMRHSDTLVKEYKDFDFDTLGSGQRFWLKTLGLFTHFRHYIDKRLTNDKVSYEIKHMFVQ